jgi:hypothetical protein
MIYSTAATTCRSPASVWVANTSVVVSTFFPYRVVHCQIVGGIHEIRVTYSFADFTPHDPVLGMTAVRPNSGWP